MYAHVADKAFVLDFVAMEACPVDAPACPRFAPFTMRIIRGNPADRTSDHLLAGWAARADVVTIIAGLTDGMRWLCLSTKEGKHLVLELPSSASSAEDERSEL